MGSSQNKLREIVIGRNLAAGITDPATGELIVEADTIVTEDLYNKLAAAKVMEVVLYATDDMSGEETETIQINISDEQSNAVLKEAMMHHFDGRSC